MSEVAKTLTFVGVSIAALLLAWVSRPGAPSQELTAWVSEKPLNIVDDPLKATQLEIVKWDAETGQKREFKVAKVDGAWSIPSHGNYPADAEKQMGAAGAAVMNLKRLDLASEAASEHETFGVVDPEKAEPGTKGVGTRVTMRDAKNESLVNMVIGTPVKGNEKLRYVREVGKNPVYVVEIDPAKLSTKFEDWIEKDLLKLRTSDIQYVQFNDYAIDIKPEQNALGIITDRKDEIGLTYDDGASQWRVKELREWDPKKKEYVPAEVPKGQVVNDVRLNDMKSALADLKIINVQKKPKGLSRDLRADREFIEDREAAMSLFSRGFIPVQGPDDSVDILSNQGDFVCRMNDGVEYVLRFGGIEAGHTDQGEAKDAKTDEKPGEKLDEQQGNNRYLLVAVRFNPDAIPKPQPPQTAESSDEKPAAKEDDEAAGKEEAGEEKAGDEQEGKSKAGEEKEGGDEKSDEKADDAKPDDSKAKAGDEGEVNLDATEPINFQPAKDDAEAEAGKPADKKPAAADEKGEKKSAAEGTEPGEKEPADKAPEAPATEDATSEKENSKKPAEKEAVEEPVKEPAAKKIDPELEKKQAEARAKGAQLAYEAELKAYEQKIKQGEERVQELNARFGPWYYVISDSVFKKIHLTRAEVFKAAEAEKKEGENPLKVPTGIPGIPGGIDSIEGE